MHESTNELELQKPEYALIRIADTLEAMQSTLTDIYDELACSETSLESIESSCESIKDSFRSMLSRV